MDDSVGGFEQLVNKKASKTTRITGCNVGIVHCVLRNVRYITSNEKVNAQELISVYADRIKKINDPEILLEIIMRRHESRSILQRPDFPHPL